MASVSRWLGGRDILDQLIQAAAKICAESLKDIDVKPLGGFIIHPRKRPTIQSGIAGDVSNLQPTLTQYTREVHFDHRGNKKIVRRSF
jgi:hypothetical protein